MAVEPGALCGKPVPFPRTTADHPATMAGNMGNQALLVRLKTQAQAAAANLPRLMAAAAAG